MRYLKLLLLICALAVLVSGVAGARGVSRMAACGTITAIDSTAGTLTVTPPAPPAGSRCTQQPPVTFSVTATTKIWLDDDAADLTALKVGQRCAAFLVKAADETWTAQRVCATTPFVVGSVAAVDTAANTVTVQPPGRCSRNPVAPVQFQIADTTVVTKNGTIALADLLIGDYVRVSYLETAHATTVASAIAIDVIPDCFSGKVLAVDAVLGTITVQGCRNTTLAFSVDPTATIKRARAAATLADIQVGDSVGITYFHMSADALLAVDICAMPPMAQRPRH